MENFMNVVKASAMLVCVLFTLVSIIGGVIGIVWEHKKAKASVRKKQIEVGKSVNDRFEEIQKQLDQMIVCIKSVQSRTDKNAAEFEKLRNSTNNSNDQYNKNIKLIANDVDAIFNKLDNKVAADGIYISRNVLWELIRVLMADNAQEATKIIEEKIFANMTPEDIPDDIKKEVNEVNNSEAKPADDEHDEFEDLFNLLK